MYHDPDNLNLFVNTSATIVILDFFKKSQKIKRSLIISGGTGAGKSMLLNRLRQLSFCASHGMIISHFCMPTSARCDIFKQINSSIRLQTRGLESGTSLDYHSERQFMDLVQHFSIHTILLDAAENLSPQDFAKLIHVLERLKMEKKFSLNMVIATQHGRAYYKEHCAKLLDHSITLSFLSIPPLTHKDVTTVFKVRGTPFTEFADPSLKPRDLVEIVLEGINKTMSSLMLFCDIYKNEFGNYPMTLDRISSVLRLMKMDINLEKILSNTSTTKEIKDALREKFPYVQGTFWPM
ncbi:MAG: AAA family ATPase [Verrucomicrobiota bacterium]